MNARTIQHPGIEINEIDMTEYRDTVTTNNAYVIGFADRGPIYDYSWITTRSEFINLYGEPQNEAEKYLYYAVQSILNNGGTPIVARMPYDNKQGKAYKGLKIKYASYKKDSNADGGYIVYDWNNDQSFSRDAIPLVSLTEVGSYINPNGFNTVYETLKSQTVKLINYPTNSYDSEEKVEYNSLSPEDIGKLTYSDLLLNLAPQLGVEKYFDTLSSDDPEVILYKEINNAISEIDSINAFINVNVHPKELKTVSGITTLNAFGSLTGSLDTIYDCILGNKGKTDEMLKKYDIFEAKLNVGTASSPVLSGLKEIFDFYISIDPILQMTEKLIDGDNALKKFFKQYTPQQITLLLGEKLKDLREKVLKINTVEGQSLTSYDSAKSEIGLLRIYLNAEKAPHDKTVGGVYNLLTTPSTSVMFKHILDAKIYDDDGKDPSGNYFTLDKVLGAYDPTIPMSTAVEVPSSVDNDWSQECFKNSYGNVIQTYGTSFRPDIWLDIFTLEYSDSAMNSTTGMFRSLLINDKYPSGLAIPENVIINYVSGLMALPSAVLEAEISTITGCTPAPSGDQAEQKAIDEVLTLIYNDPYFKQFDGSIKGQAIVDAHLLTSDEINYQNVVYLDSKECDISNEQYDDLVTTNNFTKADMSVNKYGEDIDNANFVIIDKHKTIVDGTGSNEGYFITLIDPYDALKNQRLLVNPCEAFEQNSMVTNSYKNTLNYYADQSKYNWKVMFKNEINTMNTLQRVKNADGIWVGEVNQTPGKEQVLDSWSVPLTGNYYDESISKTLMNMFPQIPLTDVASNASSDNPLCTIDKQYSSHIVVAVCKTVVNPSDGKITISILEQFFGSLFDEKNIQNGRDLYIGNIINANSNYIEFYRNNYIKPEFGSGYDPEPYNKTAVPQFFIKDSIQLNNACKMVGIDPDIYDIENIYFDKDGNRLPSCPALIVKPYTKYIEDLAKSNIFIFNKKTTIFYNNHPEAEFTSFSKKESQKIIANTTGLFGQEAGTTANIGDNFIIDMDRCISFIKNIDDIPIYFVADAGLSTIAQFCDNVVWDQTAMKWVTQNFDPDNDPDSEDRYITDYSDVSTWRKVVDKLDQISREIRRDCMTIIDAPRQLTLDGAAPKIRRSRPQNTWDDMVGTKLRFISGINSSYCAGYYNWLRTTDDFSGKSFWLPPTCKIIGNYMYLNIVNLPWLAPAGLSYGVINGIHGISHNPSPNEEDQIYLKSWNYIKQYPFDGFIIEGQKTTLTKNSAFNRINVRTLFLDLERFVYNVARNFKYQVNNSYTREQFVQTIKPKFEDYMIRGGLYDYLIKCDDTNNTPETIDANELRCAIYLKPARLIEFIMIDMVAAKTSANLEEIVL